MGAGELTPVNEPIITWTGNAGRSPRDYLRLPQLPHSQEVMNWANGFFGTNIRHYDVGPRIRPLRPDAPTMVMIFYPRPDQEAARPIHQSESYLKRIERIAQMKEQTIIYAPPELAWTLRSMRLDSHWHIITDFPTVWDIPTNRFQRENFESVQPQMFREFQGYSAADGELQPVERYNRAHHSAVWNAKAYIMWDAVMRNPFHSERWMYVDAGFLFDDGPVDSNGVVWGDLIKQGLDTTKIDRAISVSQHTGVVMGEYSHRDGCPTINDKCWFDPALAWRARQFIANVYVGSSLGMLNYSVRFMQTVDDMDANGLYTGREEFVIAFVALRYPNSVFSIPWFPLPPQLDYRWQFPSKLVFSGVGGPESVPPIVDPLSTLYVPGYVPRRPQLPAGGIYVTSEQDKQDWEVRHGLMTPMKTPSSKRPL